MNEDLFDKVCREVCNGAKFMVDFKTRSLKLNGEYIVKDGVTEEPIGYRYIPDNFFYHVEDFYAQYKYSIPSERSEGKSKRYFYALPEDKLTDEDMMFGIGRDLAQAQLEVYILCCLLEGLVWDDSWGSWFWQSPNDRDLILLRSWVEP